MSSQFYSVDQVAEILNLQPRTIRGLIRDGKLKAARIGKQYRILHTDLDALAGDRGVKRHTGKAARMVSTTIDFELRGQADVDRVFGLVSGVFTTGDGSRPPSRIDTIHYEEENRLKVVLQGDFQFIAQVTSALFSLFEN